MIGRLFGHLMRGIHAGEAKLVWNQPEVLSPETIVLSSSAFLNGATMPTEFAGVGTGKNQSPPLNWTHLPSDAVELALVVEDPDAPLPVTSVHLIATGISPHIGGLASGALNRDMQPSHIRFGKGVLGRQRYDGPTPPPGHGPHRYFFQVFALSRSLRADIVFDRKTLLKALDGAVLSRGRLIGSFERK